MKQMHVYIVRCRDESYYVGVANDIQNRIEQHNQGLVEGYTSTRLPVVLLYYESYQSPEQAIAREKQLKGWSRKKKEALISGELDVLRELSNCHDGRSFRR